MTTYLFESRNEATLNWILHDTQPICREGKLVMLLWASSISGLMFKTALESISSTTSENAEIGLDPKSALPPTESLFCSWTGSFQLGILREKIKLTKCKGVLPFAHTIFRILSMARESLHTTTSIFLTLSHTVMQSETYSFTCQFFKSRCLWEGEHQGAHRSPSWLARQFGESNSIPYLRHKPVPGNFAFSNLLGITKNSGVATTNKHLTTNPNGHLHTIVFQD